MVPICEKDCQNNLFASKKLDQKVGKFPPPAFFIQKHKIFKPHFYCLNMSSYQNKRIRFNDFAKSIYLKKIVKCKSEASKIANTVMNFFGYEDRMIDNLLNQEDRNLFYILEDENILFSQEETYRLLNGKNWRTHYWVLNKEEILSTIDEDSRFCNLIKNMNENDLEEFKEIVKSIENGCNSKEELEYFHGDDIQHYIKILEDNNIIESNEENFIRYDIINESKLNALC